MTQAIHAITLRMPLGMGTVNCYLLQAAAGSLLIDTGVPHARKALLGELERCGCKPGSLRLVVLTHGDFDHTGNAAYIRQVFGCKIAMHQGDAAMAELADMFIGRKKKPSFILRALIPSLMGFGKSERFSPDTLLEDGYDLSGHGFDARVIGIPGHSPGSIGILTADGDLFCGDLFENIKGPALNSLMDDPPTAADSAAKLRSIAIRTVYPGHGNPFSFNQLPESLPQDS